MNDLMTGRTDEYKGSIAFDHRTYGNILGGFLMKNFQRKDSKSIKCSYSGCGNKLCLKVTFSDNTVGEIEITLKTFFELFNRIEFEFSTPYVD